MALLRTNLVVGSTLHVPDHNQLGKKLNGAFIDVVADYGAPTDFSTDARSTCQQAIDEAPNGSTIFFPGRFKIGSPGLNADGKTGLRFLGTNGLAHTNGNVGSELVANTTNMTILHMGFAEGTSTAGGSWGSSIEHLMFSGPTSTDRTCIGVRNHGLSRWEMQFDTFRYLKYGVSMTGDSPAWGGSYTGGDVAWGTIHHCLFKNSARGIFGQYNCGPHLLMGGEFTGMDEYGIFLGGGSATIFGAKFDTSPVHIYTRQSSANISHCAFEDASNVFVIFDRVLDHAADIANPYTTDTTNGDGNHNESGRGNRLIHCDFARPNAANAYLRITNGYNGLTGGTYNQNFPMVFDNWTSGTFGGVNGVDNQSTIQYRRPDALSGMLV